MNASPTPKKRILIVDDEIEIREMVSEFLEFEGYFVEKAESGNSALSLLKRERFDAVITDIRMPDGDGTFLAGALLSFPVAPVVIFMTGFDDMIEKASSPFSKYPVVNKPFNFNEIKSRLESVIPD